MLAPLVEESVKSEPKLEPRPLLPAELLSKKEEEVEESEAMFRHFCDLALALANAFPANIGDGECFKSQHLSAKLINNSLTFFTFAVVELLFVCDAPNVRTVAECPCLTPAERTLHLFAPFSVVRCGCWPNFSSPVSADFRATINDLKMIS